MTDANTPEISPVTPETAQHHGDELLAALLSRLAALQGHAVGRVTMLMTQTGLQGADIADMGRAEQALEIWTAVFPSGHAIRMEQLPEPHDMPGCIRTRRSRKVAVIAKTSRSCWRPC